ncbi:MAG: hypothetical protein H0U53_08460 [Actinobacteria bacterium]|nr:hypothetical protein [Actinomycetota bacterium]
MKRVMMADVVSSVGVPPVPAQSLLAVLGVVIHVVVVHVVLTMSGATVGAMRQKIGVKSTSSWCVE